jgi:hypothetical protein
VFIIQLLIGKVKEKMLQPHIFSSVWSLISMQVYQYILELYRVKYTLGLNFPTDVIEPDSGTGVWLFITGNVQESFIEVIPEPLIVVEL